MYVTRTITATRAEWQTSKQVHNQYMVDSGILPQVLPTVRYAVLLLDISLINP